MVAYKSRTADGANLYRNFGPTSSPQWVLYDPDECIVSDYCKLTAGQTSPADLKVVDVGDDDEEEMGECCVVDAEHVTGSMTPEEKGVGGVVYAGSVVLRGTVIGE